VRTLFYPWDIQNYSQISIPRSWSKLKLDHAFSLDLGLTSGKIAQNVTKVGGRTCLPTEHPNLCSIFNSEKLVKVETRPCILAILGLKGGENNSERHERLRARLSTNGTSKSTLKFHFPEFGQSRNATMRFH
jgi:hypothetical protein